MFLWFKFNNVWTSFLKSKSDIFAFDITLNEYNLWFGSFGAKPKYTVAVEPLPSFFIKKYLLSNIARGFIFFKFFFYKFFIWIIRKFSFF